MDDIIIIIVIQNELMGIIQSFIRIKFNHYRMIARTIVPPQKKEKGGRRMRNREIPKSYWVFGQNVKTRSKCSEAKNCLSSKSVNLCLLDSVESIIQGIKIL